MVCGEYYCPRAMQQQQQQLHVIFFLFNLFTAAPFGQICADIALHLGQLPDWKQQPDVDRRSITYCTVG